MSHDRICTVNVSVVSVVRINGNIIFVGFPTVICDNGMRFGAPARVFEPRKGCVLACFGARCFASIRFRVQISDVSCRTIAFVP